MESKERLSTISAISGGLLVLGVLGSLATASALNKPLWGILLTDFLYFVGLTQGALAVAVILRITTAKWSALFYRLSSAAALAFFPLGLVILIVIFLARESIFYWVEEANLHLWYNSFFFIARNLIPFLIFYLIAQRLFNKSISAADASLDSSSKVSPFTDEGFGEIEFKGSDLLGRSDPRSGGSRLNNELLVLGFLLLLSFAVYETIMSWDLGMILNSHFADTAYAPLFIVGSVYGGVASLIIFMVLAKRYLGVESFGTEQFTSMAQLLLGLSVLWFYVWWTQFFSIWFVNLPEETEPIYLRIFSRYGIIFAASIILMSVIPFFTLILKKVRESVTILTMVSLSVLGGLWLDRYLIVIPALEKKDKIVAVPLITPIDILFTLGVLGGFFYVLLYILKRYPKVFTSSEEKAHDILVSEPGGWQ